MNPSQSSSQTGTRDETFDIVSILYHALQAAETCQKYRQDAGGDAELTGFFDEVINQQRQLADRAEQLLHSRLQPSGETSAFRFGEPGSEQDQFGGGGPTG